jgi:hypothetical protein
VSRDNNSGFHRLCHGRRRMRYAAPSDVVAEQARGAPEAGFLEATGSYGLAAILIPPGRSTPCSAVSSHEIIGISVG